MNVQMVAQGRGFLKRYFEILQEENRAGSKEAEQWFSIVDEALLDFWQRAEIAERKLEQIKTQL